LDALEGRTLGPYVLEQRRGSGGMANVYHSHRCRLDQARAASPGRSQPSLRAADQ